MRRGKNITGFDFLSFYPYTTLFKALFLFSAGFLRAGIFEIFRLRARQFLNLAVSSSMERPVVLLVTSSILRRSQVSGSRTRGRRGGVGGEWGRGGASTRQEMACKRGKIEKKRDADGRTKGMEGERSGTHLLITLPILLPCAVWPKGEVCVQPPALPANIIGTLLFSFLNVFVIGFSLSSISLKIPQKHGDGCDR